MTRACLWQMQVHRNWMSTVKISLHETILVKTGDEDGLWIRDAYSVELLKVLRIGRPRSGLISQAFVDWPDRKDGSACIGADWR